MTRTPPTGKMILHIGAPKTGSTFIQKRLRADPDALREAGIYYPLLAQTKKLAGNAKLLAIAFLGKPTLAFGRSFPDIDVPALDPADILTDLLSGWRDQDEDIVLSAENFRPSHAAQLRAILPDHIAPTPVLFIRRQDDWLMSYFNQLTKTRDTTDSLPEFIDRICGNRDERFAFPDWFANYTAWKDAFGICKIVYFEEARADYVAAFSGATGLPPLPAVAEDGRKNVSMNAYQLACLLEMDKQIPFADFSARRRAVMQAKPPADAMRKVTFLSPEQRSTLMDRFAPSNRALLEALGRRDDPFEAHPAPHADYVPLADFWQSDSYRTFKAGI